MEDADKQATIMYFFSQDPWKHAKFVLNVCSLLTYRIAVKLTKLKLQIELNNKGNACTWETIHHFTTAVLHFTTAVPHFTTTVPHFNTTVPHFTTAVLHFTTTVPHFTTDVPYFTTMVPHFTWYFYHTILTVLNPIYKRQIIPKGQTRRKKTQHNMWQTLLHANKHK